ncbi:MAG: GerAB/ArcD/ProY family transporter [Clostridia bacterium]|nr:GerAB/ArcD/ProY family transporter [Clostridia bacterium]
MSKRQFVFITACFVQGSFMYTMYYYQIAGNESWITLLAGILLGFAVAFLYGILYKMHFDKDSDSAKGLVEINMAVYGKSFGKLLSLLYVGTLLLSCSRMLREAGQFVAGNLLMGINWTYILAILVILCGWTAFYGVKYFASIGTVTCLFMYIFTIVLFALLLPHSKLYHLLPMGKEEIHTYFKGVSLCTALPFSELVAFLIIAPDVRGENRDNLKKELFYGILAGSPFLLVSVLRDTLVLGPLMGDFSYPGYEVIRLVNYKVFSNVESLYGIIIIFLMFFKSALLFYSVAKALVKILNCKGNPLFYASISCVLFFVSQIIADSNIKLSEVVLRRIPYILLSVNVGLPLITLLITKIKNAVKK